MANSRSYILPGDPVPLERPRFSIKNKKVYNPQRPFKERARLYIKHQHGSNPLFMGPLRMSFVFYFHEPGKVEGYHIGTPDLSNLLKLIEDICSTVVYRDDCVIAEISAVKCYSTSARTEFTITELV